MRSFIVIYSLLVVINVALTPPMQVPDAFVHFNTAAGISNGGLVQQTQHGTDGFELPAGVNEFENAFKTIELHQTKATRTDFINASRGEWTSTKIFMPATNYFPLLYFPGAIALYLTRFITQKVIIGYYALELANATVFILLLAWAIAQVRREIRTLIAALAVLPMTISLAASPSPDGILIALSAVFAAAVYKSSLNYSNLNKTSLTSNSRTKKILQNGYRHLSKPETIAFVSLALIAVTNPTYIGLVFVLGLGQLQKRQFQDYLKKTIISGVVLTGIALGYIKFGGTRTGVLGVFGTKGPTGIAPLKQIEFLLHHILNVPYIIVHSFYIYGNWYSHALAGELGWINVPMPWWFYDAALCYGILLLVSAIVNSRPKLSLVTATALAVAVSVALILVAMYIAFTPVALSYVNGVQGRYFLPIIPSAIVGLCMVPRSNQLWTTIGSYSFFALSAFSVGAITIALLASFWI